MCNGKCCGVGDNKCVLRKIRKILLIVGGLNWGLVGVGMLMNTNLNIVNLFLGSWPMVEAIVYVLVGLAAIMKLVGCKCAKCKIACADCAPKVEGKI